MYCRDGISRLKELDAGNRQYYYTVQWTATTMGPQEMQGLLALQISTVSRNTALGLYTFDRIPRLLSLSGPLATVTTTLMKITMVIYASCARHLETPYSQL